MKYLVVGLGNIGAEYADTRHNIGFRVLDALAEASNVSFMAGRYGSTTTLRHKGRQIILLKPSTYMNLSGKAVRYWMEQEKIPIEKILIISDVETLLLLLVYMVEHGFTFSSQVHFEVSCVRNRSELA